MSTYNDFISKVASLNNEFNERLNDDENERCVITDGALNPVEYFKLFSDDSKPRIMWLMKEPYDSEKGTGGDWDFYKTFFKGKPSYYEKLVKGGSKPTWQPVVYITYAIMNGFLEYDEMKYIRDNPSMANELNKIAWVNIHKLPAIDMTRAKNYRIAEAYEVSKDLIKKQIELLKPHFIICGGTFNFIRYEFENLDLSIFGSVEYFKHNNIVYIHAYHPANRTITREVYCNDIISLCKFIPEEPIRIKSIEILKNQLEQLAINLNLAIEYSPNNFGRKDSCISFYNANWGIAEIDFGFDNEYQEFFFGIGNRNTNSKLEPAIIERCKMTFGKGEKGTVLCPWSKYFEEYKNWVDSAFILSEVESGQMLEKMKGIILELSKCIEG